MRSWKKRQFTAEPSSLGVSQAAVAGATRADLIKVAANFLLAHTEADRIGVWIEPLDQPPADSRNIVGLRGVVLDRDGSVTPSEWEKLSLEAPLPVESLAAGRSVEQDLEALPTRPMLGVLVGLQRAFWTPIETKGYLRGVVLAGLCRHNNANPRARLEPIVAELNLALELGVQQRLVQERIEDLAAARRLLWALANSGATDDVLTELVRSCTSTPVGEGGLGIGLSFAALYAWDHDAAAACDSVASGVGLMGALPSPATPTSSARSALVWQNDDAPWPRVLNQELLDSMWSRAQQAHGAIWSESTPGEFRSIARDIARIAVTAIDTGNKTRGLHVIGFPHVSLSGATLERLDWRAALAAVALRLRESGAQAAARATQLQTLLQVDSGATLLVDAGGHVAAMSRGAEEMFRIKNGDTLPADKELPNVVLPFVEMFRSRDQRTVGDWLHRIRGPNPAREDDTPEVELLGGTSVRLSSVISPGAGYAGISLERVSAPRTTGTECDRAELVSVIEWLEEGVVLFDMEHRIRVMNTRFAQIAGLTPEETKHITTLNGLIARLSPQTAHPEHFAERWREQTRCNDAGVCEEIQLLRPVPRVLERAARPITDASGRRIGRVEVYRDLTAQRVFQSKLLQTEKLAALGQTVTNVAHELSNPLTSILGNAQRLLVGGDSSPSDAVQQIFQEAERASTIVRQLLMSARDSRPERRSVDLNQIVSRTLELQRSSLAAENIRIEQDLDPALPAIRGDAGQLQQVLMNLIGNSRQAIQQCGNGGSLRLSTMHLGGTRALLEVSDDGPGIPNAILARIFDPFFTTKPPGVGTGLGLSIVLGIVREHGGQVHVTSPPRGGATFTLDFPAISSEESRIPAVLATGPGSGALKWEGSRKSAMTVETSGLKRKPPHRILVVEDEPTVGRLIGDVLEDEGLQVDVLRDGREALRQAEREAYDLVICDMKMPALDGQHFFQALVNSGNPLHNRFLFVTGDVIAAHTHEFLERHRLPHVAKPFRVEELTEKVNRLLAGTSPEPLPTALEKMKFARK